VYMKDVQVWNMYKRGYKSLLIYLSYSRDAQMIHPDSAYRPSFCERSVNMASQVFMFSCLRLSRYDSHCRVFFPLSLDGRLPCPLTH